MSPTAALILLGENVNDPFAFPTCITCTVTPVPVAEVGGVAADGVDEFLELPLAKALPMLKAEKTRV